MAAIKTQGSTLSVETALASTKAITGATNANPCVLTIVGNGYTNGDIIKIVDVVGMEQLNERAFKVSAAATDSVTLTGVDSTLYGTYVSGGTAAKATMAAVGKIDGMPTLFAGQANTINTTHLKSFRTENIQGLATSGTCSMSGLIEDSDAGQLAMQQANELQAEKVFTVTRSDGKIAPFVAFCDSFQIAAAANDVYRWTGSLTLRAAPTRFA
jgi:hypothetical protein